MKAGTKIESSVNEGRTWKLNCTVVSSSRQGNIPSDDDAAATTAANAALITLKAAHRKGKKLKKDLIDRSAEVLEARRCEMQEATAVQEAWTMFHADLTKELKQLQEAKEESNRQEAAILEARLAELRSTSAGGIVSAPPDALDVQVCVICQEEPKNTLFLPCRHMCACSSCSQQLVGDCARCPMCRATIDDRIEGIFQ
jgi:hypothetical protein